MRQLRTVAIATGTGRVSPQLFQSLVLTAPGQEASRKSATFVISIALHSTLALALAILPLLFGSALPNSGVLETFFATPLEISILPPPPAPPAGVLKATKPVRTVEPQASGFVAPVDVSSEIRPDDGFGEIDGERNGVAGGVPDLPKDKGVVVVVHVPDDTVTPPPPPAKVVRIGGQIAQPKLVRRVEPRYPDLAVASRVSALVILEAEVDTDGYVKTVKVLRGHPLFDASAMEAVKQWRYQALLLNGEPTGFILTVTVDFRIQHG
jgi:protein TonB